MQSLKFLKNIQSINNNFIFQNKICFNFAKVDFNTKPAICYYKVLNVSTDSRLKEIRSQYLQLAKKYHPDANPNNTQADKFKEIQEAYSVLSDKEKRQIYDEQQGLNSTWKHDNVNSGFGDSESQFNEFLNKKRKNNDDDETRDTFQNIDEQVDEYFKNKYFNNQEMNRKYPEGFENPFEMTAKLYRTHQKNVESKKDDWQEFQANTAHAYYEKKSDEQKLKEKGLVLNVITEFKIPIICGVILLTFQGVYQAMQEANSRKQEAEKIQIVTEGQGYRTKMLPLNVV